MLPVWGSPVNNPWLAAVASCSCGSEVQGAWRYREAKETKQRGRGGRKSECSTVPWKQGNQNPRDPVEGREHRNTGTFGGKMAETSSSITVSTKLERIAKLARDMPQ